MRGCSAIWPKIWLPQGISFAEYDNHYQEQTAQIASEDTNITLAGSVSEDELAAADFHMISLRDGWEGIVAPSKFFDALALGRPVLFVLRPGAQ